MQLYHPGVESQIAAAWNAVRPRFALMHAGGVSDDFAADVRRGLTARSKFLLPIYFYDALGSALFDAICELPEYYVTRAETSILTAAAKEIVSAFGTPIRLVELGSGSARKTRLLIDALDGHVDYVPVAVDRSMLEEMGHSLVYDCPRLRVTAMCS